MNANAATASTPATTSGRSGGDQPRRTACRHRARPAADSRTPAAVRPMARCGDGWVTREYGGRPGRPGSAGSITEGPSSAVSSRQPRPAAPQVIPAAPERAARGSSPAASSSVSGTAEPAELPFDGRLAGGQGAADVAELLEP